MPLQSPPRASLSRFINSPNRGLLPKAVLRKLICFLVMMSLPIWPGGLVLPRAALANSHTTVHFLGAPLGYLPLVTRSILWLMTPATRQDTLESRINAVTRLRISPIKIVAYLDQTVTFSAVPTDSLGRTVQGVKLDWRSSSPSQLSIDDSGRAAALLPGLVWVTCATGTVTATAPVLIRTTRRPAQTDDEWRADQATLRANGSLIGQSSESESEPNLLASLARLSLTHPSPQRSDYNVAVFSGTLRSGFYATPSQASPAKVATKGPKLTKASASLSPPAPPQGGGYSNNDFPYDELWSEPRNLIGAPRNRIIEPTRIGPVLPESSSFLMSIPCVGVGGRGLGVSAGLYYNGRVWFRHGNAVTFDAIQSSPSPGFTLGFGRIVAYGPANATKYILIDPDGTRRYLGVGSTRTQNVTLKTKDGTHITYAGNGSSGGTIYYPTGTRAAITAVNNRLVTSQITDTNGNYFTINYLDVTCEEGCSEYCICPIYWPSLSIGSITDSLGRIIQFNYDAEQKLISITAPGFGGTVQNPITQTVVKFDYEGRTISNSFSGLTVENRPTGTMNFIKHIYYPATQTGLLFSYSNFGMATSISLRRQMTINGSVISDGVESATVSFNYPQTGTLTDAPAFTQRTENPGGTFSYSTSDDPIAQTRTITVTLPDTTQQQPIASQMLLTRSTNASSVANGLLIQSEIKRSTTSYAKNVLTYANDPGSYPQVQSAIAYDDLGAGVKTAFDFDQYGNITNKREYGYQISGQWQVRRRTKLTYKTDTAYINEYLRSLVTQIEMMDALENTNDADDVVVAKAAITFDDYNAIGGMENYGGTAAPPGHLVSYDTTKTVRGNVTGHTEWSDIAGGVSTTRLSKIDIFGNVVKAQAPCCDEKSFTYAEDTYWSVPQQVTNGPLTGVHLTSSTTYDFNTGATKTRTDPNNLTSSFGYDTAMRNTTTTLPTSIVPTMSYNDATLSSSSYVQYWEGGVQKTITTSSVRDGWSRTIQQVNMHGGQVNTAYDSMGRVVTQTNPFTAGGQSGPVTSFQYDSLGRATVVTLPDNQTIQTAYSGNTVTITDQVNRKIKREADGLGRLTKVTEQDATGALTQETSYTYNVLNKLIGVNQGNQTRAYKYDALGRMLYERIPEQTATINDGTGTFWSSKYTHTDFDSVATKQDARGVINTYTYDNLHRLTGISYNVSGAPGVASTPGVTFTYDTSDTSSTKGLLLSINVGTSGSVYRESNTFDSFNRVSAIAHWIDTRTYTTNIQYNEISQPTQIAHIYPEYDSKARLLAVRNSTGTAHLNNASYNIAGQLTSDTLALTVNETYGYDANRMQLTTQTATKTGGPQNGLMNLTYNYQASAGQMGAGSTAGNTGQLMSISGTINQTTESAAYTYDNVGRLSTSNQTSNGSSAQRRFAYDRWGNRTGVWDAVSGGNQIQSISLQQSGGVPTNRISSVTSGSTVNYTYDSTGNVTNDGAHSYVYDAENRIVNIDSGAYTYSYDHMNRRVKKVGGGSNTHYVWEGSQVIGEYNGNTGAQLVWYYYAGSRMIGKVEGGVVRYFLLDRLSTRAVLDASGTVVGRQAHLPFGEDDFGESGTQEKHYFTSYERDGEVGTDYAVNRQYSQSVGRFTRVDPVRGFLSPQSHNRYSYVQNDPVNNTDPLGLQSTSFCHWRRVDIFSELGDDMYGWLIGFVPEGCLTIDGNFGLIPGPPPPPPADPRHKGISASVASFFDANPGCKQVFENRPRPGPAGAENEYQMILSFSNKVTLHDITIDPFWGTLTFAQLGFVPPAGWSGSDPISGFLGGSDLANPIITGGQSQVFAFTQVQSNQLFIGSLFYAQNEAGRDKTIVHEMLHFLFQGEDHVPIAESLGVNPAGNTSDIVASSAINSWLSNNCGVPKAEKKKGK